MMPMVSVRRVDTSNLMGALGILRQYSKTEPSQALHRAVAFVVNDAKAATPYTEVSRIDSELQIDTVPVLSTRGKRKGLPLKSGAKTISVTEGGLGWRVILARLHPFSHYNLLTDRKYMLNQAAFSPGGGEAGFYAAVEAAEQRMAKGRHSSTHYFKVSWNAILRKLAPFVPPGYRGAVLTWAGMGDGREVSEALGAVQPARANDPRPICVIENRLGMDDRWPTIAAIRNEAAHRILEPMLQGAINRGYDRAMAEAAKRGLLNQRPALSARGVKIT